MDVSETAAVEGNDPLSSINVANVDPPGPKIVAGRSLDRFNIFLSQLYTWLCAQPGIVIGRSSNILVKEVCPPRERRKRVQPSGNGSVEVRSQTCFVDCDIMEIKATSAELYCCELHFELHLHLS